MQRTELWFRRLLARWNALSLATQFLVAGGVVSLLAMASVGAVISKVIQDGVTHNSAAATALYVDSIIAPILPDMREAEILSDPVGHALDETLAQGALGRRLYSFRLWRSDVTILYSKDKALTGKRFEANAKLKDAFAGTLVASFEG